MIAVKHLHRANLGTKTLLVFYDERHTDLGQGILGTFEIDMNTSNGAEKEFMVKKISLNMKKGRRERSTENITNEAYL